MFTFSLKKKDIIILRILCKAWKFQYCFYSMCYIIHIPHSLLYVPICSIHSVRHLQYIEFKHKNHEFQVLIIYYIRKILFFGRLIWRSLYIASAFKLDISQFINCDYVSCYVCMYLLYLYLAGLVGLK